MLIFDEPRRSGCFRRTVLMPILMCFLAGCSTLPASGPTGHEVRRTPHGPTAPLPFDIIEVESAATLPPSPGTPVPNLAATPPTPTDLIGPGDVLNITIYEAGVALFGNSGLRSTANGATSFDPSSNAEKLPAVRVDDDGYIRLPFIGSLRAAGQTASELQWMIRAGLRGLSQNAQVMVSITESITNSVIVVGEVTRPGRLVLTTNRESLSEVIALAGGYRGESRDIVARVQRGGAAFEIRLADLLSLPDRDLRIAPGDRITLISRPQSFSVLGAPNRVEEVRFPRARVSLAQAVAIAGGANPNQGDAAAIFVFRYVPLADGTEQPVVYHVNMMKPGSYFLSQRFMMRDQDLLYVGNARANQPTKLIQLLSQLFLPIATVRTTVLQSSGGGSAP